MQTPTIKIIVLRITIVIAFIEVMIMLAFGDNLHKLSAPMVAMIDTLILVSIATPIIYLWIIKPYELARDEAVEKITYMAFHDPLTQLANRRLISEYLGKILSRQGRSKSIGALILIDLDGFKPINDQYGHSTGDTILIEMAIRLQSCVRGEDVAGRLGGDEFIILFSELDTDLELARQKAIQLTTRIQKVINQPIELNRTFKLQASIGIRLLEDPKVRIEKLVEEADEAMYRAKQAGKGQSVIY